MRASTLTVVVGGSIALFAMFSGTAAVAQVGGGAPYFPLDHRIPGRVSEWNRAITPRAAEYVQPVRIELPSIGLVTYYDGAPERRVLTQAPSQAGMIVGRTYRVEISGMPEFPGVELYPTIELLDRLHPPAGREDEFPIPLPFTEEEIETALEDRLVTKVIYLEEPRWAVPRDVKLTVKVADVPPTANLLQAADRRGRAMAIIRLGGRTPATEPGGDSRFFGDLAPVVTQQDDRSSSDTFVISRPQASGATHSPFE
jgi:hypothetical protein